MSSQLSSQLIKISLSPELVKKIDQAAQEEFANRSEFIRSAVIERLKANNLSNTRLAAAANNTDIPTEETILDLLKLKAQQRSSAKWRLEWRKEIRERSQARRRDKGIA